LRRRWYPRSSNHLDPWTPLDSLGIPLQGTSSRPPKSHLHLLQPRSRGDASDLNTAREAGRYPPLSATASRFGRVVTAGALDDTACSSPFADMEAGGGSRVIVVLCLPREHVRDFLSQAVSDNKNHCAPVHVLPTPGQVRVHQRLASPSAAPGWSSAGGHVQCDRMSTSPRSSFL